MKLCVVGTGYVGLVAGTCFAESDRQVTCVDIDREKIERLKQGILPIYEPGLDEMVLRNIERGTLRFSTQLDEAIQDAEICFIAVGTPPAEDGSADLTQVFVVTESILEARKKPIILVIKSTVPVGTQKLLRERFSERASSIQWVSNPEFLREGRAVQDFLKPDRVLIGCDDAKTCEVMTSLYQPFVKEASHLLTMRAEDAELAKYACNAMLATRISFMNELANLCDHVGADINQVRKGMGTDHRIGPHFLFAGAGYGGSCFPKDTKALLDIARHKNIPLRIVEATEEANKAQKNIPFVKCK
ncbi:MAG: UDP-glucose/GDP-mannose dehydrogenase family protein, partial [Myxococcota bacterium]